MWKALFPKEKVAVGDTVRFQPSSSSLSFKLKVYEVVKSEQHYFEMIVKTDQENRKESAERRIIKYIDIGYHLGLEVWNEPLLQESMDLEMTSSNS